ncbi:hypothetical protein ACTWQF_25365 [Streptomyces sp. 8N114]|uniref:hypothetical protein n=1 Tax=Streptomyces sp. 8N114 TaxID=3457419 RepID=UPI003FD5F24D
MDDEKRADVSLGKSGEVPSAMLDSGREVPNWARPKVEKILISPHGMAHLPGKCNHHPEVSHAEAGWGWVMWPDEGVWDLISEQRPLKATQGRTDRIARVRCGHCAK